MESPERPWFHTRENVDLDRYSSDIFTTRDACRILGPGKPTRDAPERLVDKGRLQRIEKGTYLIVPFEVGPDRVCTEDALVIGSHFVSPSMVAYWPAWKHWNSTDQLPRVTWCVAQVALWEVGVG